MVKIHFSNKIYCGMNFSFFVIKYIKQVTNGA